MLLIARGALLARSPRAVIEIACFFYFLVACASAKSKNQMSSVLRQVKAVPADSYLSRVKRAGACCVVGPGRARKSTGGVGNAGKRMRARPGPPPMHVDARSGGPRPSLLGSPFGRSLGPSRAQGPGSAGAPGARRRPRRRGIGIGSSYDFQFNFQATMAALPFCTCCGAVAGSSRDSAVVHTDLSSLVQPRIAPLAWPWRASQQWRALLRPRG